jgi:hypothetical protein
MNLWKDKEMDFLHFSNNIEDCSMCVKFRLISSDGKIFSNDSISIYGVKDFEEVTKTFPIIINQISILDLRIPDTIRFFDSLNNLLLEINCTDYKLNHKKT